MRRRAPVSSPEGSGSFPLPVAVHNEIGELIEAFNGMVASLAEQRSGLNDTLSLLDSMLANAPIGLAFFDRRCRFVLQLDQGRIQAVEADRQTKVRIGNQLFQLTAYVPTMVSAN